MKTCVQGHEYTTLKCSVCRSEYMEKYRLVNADKMNAYNRERYKNPEVVAKKKAYVVSTTDKRALKSKAYREANKEKIAVANKNWRDENAEHVRTTMQEWRQANKDYVKEFRKKYYLENKGSFLAKSKESYEKNKNAIKLRMAAYRKGYALLNRYKLYAIGAKRRAAKLQQTPPWYSHEDMIAIYKEQKPGYHVDHIVPLRGKNVSGLHWHHNLQLLPAAENISKGNKFNPDTYVHDLPLY